MEIVLRQVPNQVHRLPDSIRRNLHLYFFSYMFVEMGERAEELALSIVLDPDYDVRAELMQILATFGSITTEFGILMTWDEEDEEEDVEAEVEEASLCLIGSVSDFHEVLDDRSFQEFLTFLESLVVMFFDDSFILPSSTCFAVDYQIHVLQQAVIEHM